MKKWESKKIFAAAPTIPVCPHPLVVEIGAQAALEEVGAPCTLGPQL